MSKSAIALNSLKETGFFTEFTVCNQVFRKKNRFLGPLTSLKETGFLPNLRYVTKYFVKNPVSGLP